MAASCGECPFSTFAGGLVDGRPEENPSSVGFRGDSADDAVEAGLRGVGSVNWIFRADSVMVKVALGRSWCQWLKELVCSIW